MATKLASDRQLKVKHVFSNHAKVNKIAYAILEDMPNKQLIVAFSGTQNPEQLALEIIRSFNVKYSLHSEVNGTSVVEYFYHFYTKQFRKEFEETMNKYANLYSDFKIVFTGHSLGGAMSIHAAVDSILSEWVDPSRVAIYTYGQPRVGNNKFSDILTQNVPEVFRIIHNRDMVAHIPLWVPNILKKGCKKEGIMRSYSYHFPTEVWYNQDMQDYAICDGEEGEDQKWSNSVVSNSIGDHMHYFGYRIGSLFLIDEVSDDE